MISFVKAHACGNDFLIVEDALAQGKHAEQARILCERNTGVGADGVEYVDERPDGTIKIRLMNADGSEAEISGNGTRCVAAWLAYSEKKTDVALVTKAGPRHCRVISQEGNTVHIATEMGVPTARNLKLTFEGGLTLDGVEVSVGNPHYIVFVETEDFSVNGIAWQQMGAKICAHKAFPHSTNAEFVRVVDKNTIAFRIFERGVGPTLSSGTGTCASATASIFSKGTARHLTVQAEGGDQIIHWPADDQPILLTGPATIIARGVAITS